MLIANPVLLPHERNAERNDDPSDFRRCRGPRIASAGHSPGSGRGGPLVCGDDRRRPLGLPLLARRRMSAERGHGQSWLLQSEPVRRCDAYGALPYVTTGRSSAMLDAVRLHLVATK